MSEMVRIWSFATKHPQSAFCDFAEKGGFHHNSIAKALSEGVIKHSSDIARTSKTCGREMVALHATTNPVLMQFRSIKQRNAQRIIDAAAELASVYVRYVKGADGYVFVVQPAQVRGALEVDRKTTVDMLVKWAATK